MSDDNKNIVKIFKAFCDEKRIQILRFLQDGEKCACVLQELVDIKQSALSYHMKILCESGVVICRQAGKWTHYSISKDGAFDAAKTLLEITKHNTDQTPNEFYLEKLETTSA